MMRIEPFGPEVFALVKSMAREFKREISAEDARALHELQAYTWAVARETNEGQPIGCVAWRELRDAPQYFWVEERGPERGPERTRVAYADYLYVKQSHRHAGLGQKLVEYAEREIQRAGFHIIQLNPSPKARAFYERLGFSEANALEKHLTSHDLGATY